MSVRTLAVVGVLVVVAYKLSRALVSHDGVGPIEWIVGIVIVIGLLLLAAQKFRRALGQG